MVKVNNLMENSLNRGNPGLYVNNKPKVHIDKLKSKIYPAKKSILKTIGNYNSILQARKAQIIRETSHFINRIESMAESLINQLSELQGICLKIKNEPYNLSEPNAAQSLNSLSHSILEIKHDQKQNNASFIQIQANPMRQWERFLNQTSSPLYILRVSDDKNHVFVGSYDHTIRMWNLSGRNLEHTFNKHLDRVYCIDITKDSKFLISGSNDKTIIIWDLKTRSYIACLHGHEKGVRYVTATSDSLKIISSSFDWSIKIWCIQSKKLLNTLSGHNSTIWSVVILKDNKNIISCSYDKTIRFWNIMKRKERKGHLESIEKFSCIAINTNETKLLSGTLKGTIEIWNLINKVSITKINAHDGWIRCLILNNNEELIFSAADDYKIKVWLMIDSTLQFTLTGHKDWIYGLSFVNDEQIVSSSLDMTIRVWSLTKECEEFQLTKTPINHSSLVVSKDRQFVAHGSINDVLIWDLIGCEHVKYEGHLHVVQCVAISDNCKYLVSGSMDETLRVWSTENNTQVCVLIGQKSPICSVAISSDIKYAISGDLHGKIIIWNLKEQNVNKMFQAHCSGVFCISISSKSEFFVSGSDDTIVKVWDFTFEIKNVLAMQWVKLDSVLISNDDKYILSTDITGLKIKWDFNNDGGLGKRVKDVFQFYKNHDEFRVGFNYSQ